MNVNINKGETAEEIFGFEEKKAKKMIEFLLDLMEKEVDLPDAIRMIYKKARNSRELGYMLIYFVSFIYASGFDKFMDEVAEEEKYVHDSNGMYW